MIEKFIVSPCHKSYLIVKNKKIFCGDCEQVFDEIENGLYNLIPKEYYLTSKYQKWINFQKEYSFRATKLRKKNNKKLDRYSNYHHEFLNKFCTLKGRVLDVGCGPMLNHFKFINKNILPSIDYFGIDPEYSFFKGGNNCLKAVGEFLPFQSDFFDSVFLISVLDHVINPYKTLSEIKRVLKKNGKIYISLPMRHLTWKTELRKFFFPIYKSKTHVTEFNENKLLNLIKKSELKVLKLKRSDSFPKNLFVEIKKIN